MKISVVVPYFNNSSSISTCLRSILIQSVQCTEIIVVDDGSSDSELLLSILQELNDLRIKYIRHDRNKNGSAARNTGISYAQGEIIALIDADDEWTVNHLETNVSFMTRISPTGLFFFISSVQVKYDSFEAVLVKPKIEFKRLADVSDEIFVLGKMLSCVTYFFPRNLREILIFDESLRRYQDIDFLLRASKLENIDIFQLDNIGATVNWNNVCTKKSRSKGMTYSFSKNYLNTRSHLFNATSARYFVMKEVLPICAEERFLLEFLRYFFHYNIYRIITIGYLIRYSVKFLDGNGTLLSGVAKKFRYKLLGLS